MQYFHITGIDEYGYSINNNYTIESEYTYANNLHFAIADAISNRDICWDDFAEGVPFNVFNDLIQSGTKTVEIHGWAGKFKVELFNNEQDEYFADLFRDYPHPWKWENNIGECGNGGFIHGVMAANGECVVSTYMGYSAAKSLFNLYKYYVSKEGIKS